MASKMVCSGLFGQHRIWCSLSAAIGLSLLANTSSAQAPTAQPVKTAASETGSKSDSGKPAAEPAEEKPLARTLGNLTRKGFAEIKKYKPDNAIAAFTPGIFTYAAKPLTDAKNRKGLARYLALVGRCMTYDGNDASAHGLYRMAHSLDPQNPIFTALVLESCDEVSRFQDIEALKKELAPYSGKNLTVTRVLAGELVRVNDYVGAQNLIEDFLANGGKLDHAGERAYTYILIRRGLQADAIQGFYRAAKLTDNEYERKFYLAAAANTEQKKELAEKLYREAGKILPDDPSWRAGLGTIFSLQSATADKARDEFTQAVQMKRYNNRALSQLQNHFLHRGDLDGSQQCIEYMKKMQPLSLDWHLSQGRHYRKQGDRTKSKAEFQKVLQVNPAFPQAYSEIGTDLVAEGKLKEALENHRLGTKNCPRHIGQWVRRCNLSVQLREWDEAVMCADKILSFVPSDTTRLNVLGKLDAMSANVALGSNDYRLGKRREAIDHAILVNQYKFVPELPSYLQMIKIRPGRLDFKVVTAEEKKLVETIALADMLLESKMFNESIQEYRRAIDMTPDDVDLHSYLLNVLVENGNWVEAAKEDFALSGKIMGRTAKDVKNWASKSDKKQAESSNQKALPPVPGANQTAPAGDPKVETKKDGSP